MELLAGLLVFLIFVGLPALVLGIAVYLSKYDGQRPFRLHLWQMMGIPFRALVPSFLTKILSQIKSLAAGAETKLHQQTVEGTITETKAWHADLKSMESRLAGLGLSTTTMQEFSTRVTAVEKNGDSLQQALDLHREQQLQATEQERKVRELENLLVQMRALNMSADALADVERKLLEATIQASQATVASHVIAKYLGTHAATPGGLVQALPDFLSQRPGLVSNRASLAIAGATAVLNKGNNLLGTREPVVAPVEQEVAAPSQPVSLAKTDAGHAGLPVAPVVSLVKEDPPAPGDASAEVKKPRKRKATTAPKDGKKTTKKAGDKKPADRKKKEK